MALCLGDSYTKSLSSRLRGGSERAKRLPHSEVYVRGISGMKAGAVLTQFQRNGLDLPKPSLVRDLILMIG